MEPGYSIRLATARDVSALPAIERAAARLLVGHAPESVLSETTSEHDFHELAAAGRLWVAVAVDEPVGFAAVELLAGDLPHLDEIDVHPDHGRRGIGAALVHAVCAWAATSGFAQVTLTTFRAVPWNMPFYARLGFEEIPAARMRPEIAAVMEDEARRGLDPDRRVAMRYRTRA